MFKKKNRCYNGGNKHNFKYRIDKIAHDRNEGLKVSGVTFETAINLLFDFIHVKKVCQWCGKEQWEETDV